jgi:hypothetical protein
LRNESIALGLTSDVARFGPIEIPEAEVAMLSDVLLVERLVEGGISRLSAERMVAIRQGATEPGRARSHMQARR